MGGCSMSLKSTILLCLSLMTLVCPVSNGEQPIARVGIVWRSSMQSFQSEGRGLHCSGQACCDTPVRAILAQRVGTVRLIKYEK